MLLLHNLCNSCMLALPDVTAHAGQVHVEVIGQEDGPQGGNRHGEGGTGAAGMRDRQSQARLCTIEVSCF